MNFYSLITRNKFGEDFISLFGYGFIVDDDHWVHDVADGATIGLFYTLGRYFNRISSSNLSLSIIPEYYEAEIRYKVSARYAF